MPDEPLKKSSIFISYARKDGVFADSIERALASAGAATWIDRQRLAGGADWPAGLREAIEACDALVLILSPQALASVAVQREYEYALRLGKRIVPVLFKRIAAPPQALAAIQWVDCTRQRGVYDLLFTLYQAGLINLRLSKGTLNPTLVLAIALHGAAADDWTVSTVSRSDYGRAAIVRMVGIVVVELAYLSALLFAIISIRNTRAFAQVFAQARAPWLTPWTVVLLTTIIAIIASAILWFRFRFYKQIFDGQLIPELLVITPEAWVQHKVRGARTIYCFFHWTQSLTRRDGWRGGQRIDVQWLPQYARHLKPLTITISARYSHPKNLAIMIMSRFWQYAQKQQPETQPMLDAAWKHVQRGAAPGTRRQGQTQQQQPQEQEQQEQSQ